MKIGNCYLSNGKAKSNRRCMLVLVDYSKVALINLDTGNRIKDPVKVVDPCHLTDDEMKKIMPVEYKQVKRFF